MRRSQYFYWPNEQHEDAYRERSETPVTKPVGDTNGMIDTNVSRANCTWKHSPNHPALFQELRRIFGEHE